VDVPHTYTYIYIYIYIKFFFLLHDHGIVHLRFEVRIVYFTVYSQKLALASPTSGSCSVGTVCSQTQATKLSFFFVCFSLVHSLGLKFLFHVYPFIGNVHINK
jgi:hypothetical protein